MARNYNKSADERMPQPDDTAELRNSGDPVRYNTWSPMSSNLPINRKPQSKDLEAICMHIPSDESYDVQSICTYDKRRASLPYSSNRPSHISALQAVNKCQLEKIPEIIITPSSNDDVSNKKIRKFVVTPSTIDSQ